MRCRSRAGCFNLASSRVYSPLPPLLVPPTSLRRRPRLAQSRCSRYWRPAARQGPTGAFRGLGDTVTRVTKQQGANQLAGRAAPFNSAAAGPFVSVIAMLPRCGVVGCTCARRTPVAGRVTLVGLDSCQSQASASGGRRAPASDPSSPAATRPRTPTEPQRTCCGSRVACPELRSDVLQRPRLKEEEPDGVVSECVACCSRDGIGSPGGGVDTCSVDPSDVDVGIGCAGGNDVVASPWTASGGGCSLAGGASSGASLVAVPDVARPSSLCRRRCAAR